ncbi:monoheme cytochrome C [Cellulophaga sp. E16_2]|uniref:monoheme cytochrome C n=1 Tax=unclassified Cellulophaga TaxID=2634405 RepID=UPI0013FD6785|nr:MULTISPECIES: monoheme cytochrome C [unclassified Cellulophaga]MBO0593841.1 monoheme cytochrome C [Cellulophaga sp. E16_2]
MGVEEKFKQSVKGIHTLLAILLIGFIGVLIILFFTIKDATTSTTNSPVLPPDYVEVPTQEDDFDKIENGIHVRTGFVEGEGLLLVVQNCTSCHSAKLVTQNRMSKDKWLATIRWMQETQNLWDLGVNEEPILNYLSTYYAPNQIGRRANLENVEWYELKE